MNENMKYPKEECSLKSNISYGFINKLIFDQFDLLWKIKFFILQLLCL